MQKMNKLTLQFSMRNIGKILKEKIEFFISCEKNFTDLRRKRSTR